MVKQWKAHPSQSLSPEQIEPRVFVRQRTVANLVVKQWKAHLSQSLSPEQIEPRVFVRQHRVGTEQSVRMQRLHWRSKGSNHKKKDSKAVPADEELGNIGPDSMGMEEGQDMGERGKGGATEDAGKATEDTCQDTTKDASKDATEDAFTH
ncbi:hypothetical protein B0H10DRAFT_1940624 [Mycena sp. CBHHK59/15]|nr:hypothetical protein B0H10DRAFT_1940624 [Mycena sp. CBHHK59/15]